MGLKTTSTLQTTDALYSAAVAVVLPVDEGTGTTITDISGSGIGNWTATGATWITDSRWGAAAQLTGGQRIKSPTGSNTLVPSTFTLLYHFRLDAVTGFGRLLQNSTSEQFNGIRIYQVGTGITIDLGRVGGGLTTNLAACLVAGQDYALAISHDSASKTWFVALNGVPGASFLNSRTKAAQTVTYTGNSYVPAANTRAITLGAADDGTTASSISVIHFAIVSGTAWTAAQCLEWTNAPLRLSQSMPLSAADCTLTQKHISDKRLYAWTSVRPVGGKSPYTFTLQANAASAGYVNNCNDVGYRVNGGAGGTLFTFNELYADFQGLTANTAYQLRLTVTDSAGTPATANGPALSITTDASRAGIDLSDSHFNAHDCPLTSSGYRSFIVAGSYLDVGINQTGTSITDTFFVQKALDQGMTPNGSSFNLDHAMQQATTPVKYGGWTTTTNFTVGSNGCATVTYSSGTANTTIAHRDILADKNDIIDNYGGTGRSACGLDLFTRVVSGTLNALSSTAFSAWPKVWAPGDSITAGKNTSGSTSNSGSVRKACAYTRIRAGDRLPCITGIPSQGITVATPALFYWHGSSYGSHPSFQNSYDKVCFDAVNGLVSRDLTQYEQLDIYQVTNDGIQAVAGATVQAATTSVHSALVTAATNATKGIHWHLSFADAWGLWSYVVAGFLAAVGSNKQRSIVVNSQTIATGYIETTNRKHTLKQLGSRFGLGVSNDGSLTSAPYTEGAGEPNDLHPLDTRHSEASATFAALSELLKTPDEADVRSGTSYSSQGLTGSLSASSGTARRRLVCVQL